MDDLPAIFKAYDIRGIYPDQLNESTAEHIGQAYAATRKPLKVTVGQDVRASGNKLKKALVDSLLKSGVDVVDIGVITTDQLYFTVGKYGYDAGISVTASHNPGEYNGFKFADAGGAPISSENLIAIRDWGASGEQEGNRKPGRLSRQLIMDDYIEHVLSYIDQSAIKPMKIVANANFGAVGRSMDIVAEKLNLKLKRLNWDEDGTFPKGPPNPLLPESRAETVALIKSVKPNLGVAWDADADRVFFFTGEGEFVPSCYIIALLAQDFLIKYPGAKIVHDITLRWVVDDAILAAGGQPVLNRVGHTFIKSRMRQEQAPFAAESSGHYYFQKSFYADNGIAPLLMLIDMISRTGKDLSELIAPFMDRYFMIDEINFKVSDPTVSIAKLETELGKEGKIDKTDGVTIETDHWRINLRPSNTEPLIRLNAEARSQQILEELVNKISLSINT